MILILGILLTLLIFYSALQRYLVRRMLKKGSLNQITLLLLAFVTGLALGSGYLNPWVWIPIALAFSIYYWPRLKAFFNTISND